MKFFYVIGVYAFCVTVHDIIHDIPHAMHEAKETARNFRQIKDIVEGYENKEENKEYRRGTVNRIGF